MKLLCLKVSADHSVAVHWQTSFSSSDELIFLKVDWSKWFLSWRDTLILGNAMLCKGHRIRNAWVNASYTHTLLVCNFTSLGIKWKPTMASRGGKSAYTCHPLRCIKSYRQTQQRSRNSCLEGTTTLCNDRFSDWIGITSAQVNTVSALLVTHFRLLSISINLLQLEKTLIAMSPFLNTKEMLHRNWREPHQILTSPQSLVPPGNPQILSVVQKTCNRRHRPPKSDKDISADQSGSRSHPVDALATVLALTWIIIQHCLYSKQEPIFLKTTRNSIKNDSK